MFPATQNTGTLIGLIQKIGSHGVPTKFTTKDLPVWGYKSSHDRSVVGVLRFVGFLDANGVPSDLWRQARTQPADAVATGVRTAYSDLFSTFPDAHRKDVEALTNYFKAKTTVSAAGVKQIVGTFKALAQIGNFDSDGVGFDAGVAGSEGNAGNSLGAGPTIKHTFSGAGGLAVNMNIELSLPADSTGEVYEKFFAAMRKHLIDAGN